MKNALPAVEEVLGLLPDQVKREIQSLFYSDKGIGENLEEIRLRADGRCSVISGAKSYPLFCRFSRQDAEGLTASLCHGSVYAYRDSISDGYIPMDSGVRVGVCGGAKYDGSGQLSVMPIGSFVFRFPPSRCDFIGELYSEFIKHGGGSLLVASAPGGGKTTALRAMAKELGRGRNSHRVVVVDERMEFVGTDYAGTTVDIMQGYKRSLGIEIALRTMSAEYILVDEICTERDADAVEIAAMTGVKIIATAHGTSLEGMKKRKCIGELLSKGCFDLFALIERSQDGFKVRVEEI